MSQIIRNGVLRAIRWYRRAVSPLFPPRCKYLPTCSQYALVAVSRFGAVRGLSLALLRILRCRPWSDGGIDDVPQLFSLFYRFKWSKAHEEPRLTPLAPEKEMA
ncbi:membrane protein insertion efficiency factor YidD [Bifidobacterium sp.]|uniref:membrane protein insertion efficiency factor YidD n=1 Tax=Bifidobacterium sp. TaxID=41200 RepID=UPI0025BE7A3A|nr:membrane protein insertion efficiency factor YidD [Bifidobacterium sp.]MCI1634814.1 membrane protein insertion efficiency factor YidD [Bifidobacterium sp.]